MSEEACRRGQTDGPSREQGITMHEYGSEERNCRAAMRVGVRCNGDMTVRAKETIDMGGAEQDSCTGVRRAERRAWTRGAADAGMSIAGDGEPEDKMEAEKPTATRRPPTEAHHNNDPGPV